MKEYQSIIGKVIIAAAIIVGAIIIAKTIDDAAYEIVRGLLSNH